MMRILLSLPWTASTLTISKFWKSEGRNNYNNNNNNNNNNNEHCLPVASLNQSNVLMMVLVPQRTKY
jgi:hypothetical protein